MVLRELLDDIFWDGHFFFNLKYSGEKSFFKNFSLDLALAPCQIGETMKLNP